MVYYRCFLFPFLCNMKTLHKIYIYRDAETTSLPEDGWFQRCFVCYTITSYLSHFETFEYGKQIYNVEVYLCPCCQKKIENNTKFKSRYEFRCNRYLKRNFAIDL